MYNSNLVVFLCLLSSMIGSEVIQLVQANTEVECTCNNSYLWKIEAEPPIYLYGTLHVPYTKLWSRIPVNQKTAFSSSDSLMVELKLSDSKTLKRLSDCQFLPNEETLHSILPIELYNRIERYFDRIRDLFLVWLKRNSAGGVNPFIERTRDAIYKGVTHDWQKRRPIWLLFLLDSLTENLIRYRSTPVLDTFLDNAADGLEKRSEAVENVGDHCRPLNNLKNDDVIIALRKKLDELEPQAMYGDGPQSSEDSYVKTYFCGDFENLVQTTEILPLPDVSNMTNLTSDEAQIIKNMNTKLRKQIVYRRNRKMARFVEEMLNDKTRNETSFFAVGAGHFLGRKSIVDLLQRRNYTVKRISVQEHIDGPDLPGDIIALGDPSSVHKILPIPKEIVTEPPSISTLPPLSKEDISKIFNEVFNSTKTYKVDSVEVSSISPSVSASPSSSLLAPSPSPVSSSTQTTPTSQPSYITTKSGIVIAIMEEEIESDQELNSASNNVRWNATCTVLLALVSVLALSKLL